MSPTLILDRQLDLLSRCDDAVFKTVLRAWFRLDLGANVENPRHMLVVEHNAGVLADAFCAQVKTAYAYRVTEEMGLLVQQAATALDEEDVFDRDLAPTGAGIVRFDLPLPIADIRGETMLAHWMIWGPAMTEVGPATLVTLFNDGVQPDNVPIENEDRYRDICGWWNWVGANYASHGAPLGGMVHPPSEETIRYATENGFEAVPTTNAFRYVHALWLMLNQTITAVEEEVPDRAGRRRWERKMPLPARVSVIQLRRTESGHRPEGESLVEWQHRWLVRGHWAWRNCGPGLDGAQPYEKGHRRRLWIPGYVKGPEDKPLMITDKVYDLRR